MLALLLVLVVTATATAQESPAPQTSVTASDKSVRISFLPPPLEGTFSLGIYDPKGKLVRVLHRESELEDFEIKEDALATTWDGKDDAGASMPPGKYHARGFAVGDLEIEGVGFFFNDWIIDEQSPRIRRISEVTFNDRRLILVAEAAGTESLRLLCDDSGQLSPLSGDLPPVNKCVPPSALTLVEPISCDLGRDETVWVIDRLKAGAPETEVKQFSSRHELLRRLSISPGDPQPIQIAVSKSENEIVLLEENGSTQRLRELRLLSTKSEQDQTISDWKVEFEKKIVRHKDFAIESGQPVIAGGKMPPEKIALLLKENPLQDDKKGTVELAAGYDENGSFLKTADGLPLQTISETKNLTRTVLSPRGEKSIDVFQDDDAVVEQFRVSRLDEMMAFDCGEIELK